MRYIGVVLALTVAIPLLACDDDRTVAPARVTSAALKQGAIFLGRETPCQFSNWGPSLPLSSGIPGDFHSPRERAERTLENLQCDFDVYSWETFIALNWPADAGGDADNSLKIGSTHDGDHRTVWERWKPVPEVFLRDGRRPNDWNAPPELPSWWQAQVAAGNVHAAGIDLQKAVEIDQRRFLTKIAKGHEWFATEQPFNTGPLIDQNGEYARFELLINEPMFDYIVNNNLYNVEGQEAFEGDIVFPCGKFKKDNPTGAADGRPVTEGVGAIVLKAAWKVLSPAEIAGGRFHKREAVACVPNDPDLLARDPADPSTGTGSDLKPTPTCKPVTIGLVGLHIVHKSEDVPQWNWSTFEHVDNVPTFGAVDPSKSYSFYSAAHGDLPINAPPPRPWDPRSKVMDPTKRSQIVRMIPISNATRLLNAEYQARLRAINPNSVWQYYQLISTQWPTRPALAARDDPNFCNAKQIASADLLGGPAPVFLGNSTLESYIQGQVPNTSSSCMDCHANATTADGRYSDFTYILERANSTVH